MTESKEDWSPTLFYFTIYFPMLLSEKHATYHRFESTVAKASIAFSWKSLNTIALWLQFYLSYCFYMFSWCFNIFLWHSSTVYLTGSSGVARASVAFFLFRFLFLLFFNFFAHRSNLKNFQTYDRNHPNKLLFGNSHLLQFSLYFLWVHVI